MNSDIFTIVAIPGTWKRVLDILFWFRQHNNFTKIFIDKQATTFNFTNKEIKKLYPGVSTIAVIFNPWERMVNNYLHHLSKGSKITFDGFISEFYNLEISKNAAKCQLDFIDGVDYLLRDSNFREDFKTLQYYLNDYRDISLTDNKIDYKKLYNSNTINFVNELYKRDIEYFKFNLP